MSVVIDGRSFYLTRNDLTICQHAIGRDIKNQNTKLFIHENASENIVCEMAAILSTGR